MKKLLDIMKALDMREYCWDNRGMIEIHRASAEQIDCVLATARKEKMHYLLSGGSIRIYQRLVTLKEERKITHVKL